MADRTSERGAEGSNEARDGPSRHGAPIVVLAAGLIVLALGLATCGAGLLALVRGSHRLAVVAGIAVTAPGLHSPPQCP